MTNKTKIKSKTIIILFAWFGIQFSLLSETVILWNHEVIHGKITYQDANILKIKDDNGKSVEYPKNDILRVSYRDVKDTKEINKIIEEEERKHPTEKRRKIVKKYKKSKWEIVARSTILPGWGQWKADKKRYAGLSFVAVTGAGIYTYVKYIAFKKAETTYNQNSIIPGFFIYNQPRGSNFGTTAVTTLVLANKIYQPFKDAQIAGNNAIQLLSFIYATQLIHSYFIGSKWEKDGKKTTIGNIDAIVDWSLNASAKPVQTPIGLMKETYLEASYVFQF